MKPYCTNNAKTTEQLERSGSSASKRSLAIRHGLNENMCTPILIKLSVRGDQTRDFRELHSENSFGFRPL